MNDTPQLTLRAVILSVLLTVVLAAANAYLGLFAGLTVATAIPAAVVSMGVLRLLGRTSVLENNIVATGASAGSSIAAGTVFTMPALVILGHWARFDYWWVFAIIGLGGILGVLFSVPLRRTLIIDQQLQFPEGVATAELLRAGSGSAGGARLLGFAALAGAVFKLVMSGLRFVPESFTLARYFGARTIGYVGVNLSPALLGVGYIVGVNIGLVMVAGGLIAWWLFIPVYNTFLFDQDPGLAALLAGVDAETAANLIWTKKVRYIGVGAMLIGGLWALWTLRSSLLSGVKSGLSVGGTKGAVADTERDLPMGAILAGIAVFVLPLFALYHAVVGSYGVAAAMAVIMIVAGFVFSSVSGYMAGLVGSSNNPVSGITISTILFASLVLLALVGSGSSVGPVAAILIGAVTCSAAAVAGDNLQDLKAGRLLGATPWRQQVMLAIGALAGAAIMAPVLNLLLEAYGIGTPAHAGVKALNAPQATLMAAVAKGIFARDLPWSMIGLGAAVGATVIAFDLWLKHVGGRWRAPVLAVAVGIYLPLEYTSPIFLGGLISELVDRWQARHGAHGDPEALRRNGLLFASGLIAGEAIVGVLIAIPIVLTGNVDVLALPASLRFGQWLGLACLAAIGWRLYRSAARLPDA
ncbi:MAG TPA: oligopeptide transporter, OPT family [Steroidobacteraceae bacterium]|nr:oligopeptide transporter, OPT family [Steroidobacteraceae bacterium]